MSEEQTASGQTEVNLARVPSFRLGKMDVLPATRQVKRGDQSETLEPRVMQVLVALWQAGGAVVTRDDLIRSCWAGRVVGENAIQRAISRLRDIASTIGSDSFRLETLNKVGYRLIEISAAAAEPQISETEKYSGKNKGRALLAAAVAGAILSLAFVAWMLRPSAETDTIAVAAASGDDRGDDRGDEPGLAASLGTDLTRLTDMRAHLFFRRDAQDKQSDFLLKVIAHRTGAQMQVDASLARNDSTDLLWASSFGHASRELTNLRQQVANRVARVINCAAETSGSLRRSDDKVLRLLFTACERLDDRLDNPDELTVESWQRVVDADKSGSAALATLAFLEAELASTTDGAEAIALRATAERNLQKARSMNGRLGLPYAAEAVLLPPWRYRERMTVLDHGLALDPDCAVLYDLKGRMQQDIGRLEDAVASLRRAVELEPSSASHRQGLISVLAYAGYVQTARTELEADERIWPDTYPIQETRFRFDLRFGDPNGLIRKIDSGNVIPNAPEVLQRLMVRSFLRARANPTPQNVASAVDLSVSFVRNGGAPQVPLQSIATFGHVDDAYALLDDPAALGRLRAGETDILFRVNMRAFRLDRRFMTLAARLGLVEFWRSSNTWPDFCRDEDLTYNCKAESGRLRS